MRYLPPTAAAALALSASLGCGDGSAFFDDPSLIVMETAVEPESVAPGDTIRVTVTARNPTGILLRIEYSCAALSFDVLAPDGTAVDGGDGFQGCLYILEGRPPRHELVIPPGGAERQEFTWTAQRRPYGTSIPPGRYEIVGLVRVPDGPRSAPVPVDVVPVLELSTEVTPSPAAVGAAVNIEVTVANRARRAVTIAEFSSCGFGVWVKREAAPLLRLSNCSPPDPEVTLRPGERLQGVLRWTPAEPGAYRVFVQLALPGEPRLRTVTPLLVGSSGPP